jgi:ArsR family transcriptional regulator, arsenate/arsenite/antimonite-responsive transcriptional repressor
MDQLLKALKDPTRREILNMLRERDLTAGEIAQAFDMSKPSISHHLSELKEADLVHSIRSGQFIRYSLHTTALDDLLVWLMRLQAKDERPGRKVGG